MNKMIPNECSLLRMTSTFHQKPSVQSKPEFRGRDLDDGCQGSRGWPVISDCGQVHWGLDIGSVRRLIGSLWANTKVITITE